MRYFIIGFKSSGKTTIGKKLAHKLGMKFIDLDDLIESMTGRRVTNIFEDEGEEKFRKMEWDALKEAVKHDDIVVSTGGGAPCHCDNMTLMEKYGEVIYLQLDNSILISRLKSATRDRPIVKDKNDEELRIYVEELKLKCEHHYKRAKYIINAADIKIADLVSLLYKEKK